MMSPDRQRDVFDAYERVKAAADEARKAEAKLYLALDDLRKEGFLHQDFWHGVTE